MGAAHLGIKKAQSIMAKVAVWSRMTSDIKDIVTSCPQCQVRAPKTYKISEPL